MTAVDPRVRVGTAVTAIVVVAAAPRPGAGVGVAVLALTALVIRGPKVWRLAGTAVGLGAIAALAAAVASRGAPDAISRGLVVSARVFAGSAVGAWLCATVPAPALLGALAWVRCPRPLLELLALTTRQAAELRGVAVRVRAAQQARLGYAGVRRGLRSAGQLAGAVAGSALHRAEALSDALALRGAPPIAPLPQLRVRGPRHAAFAVLAAAALAGCVLLGWGAPW